MNKTSLIINILSKISVVITIVVLGSYIFEMCSLQESYHIVNYSTYKTLIIFSLILLIGSYAARIIDIIMNNSKRQK